jgi:uncharacterized protein
MLYMIIGEDYPNSLVRRQTSRPAHVQRLNQLQAQGRLILAGPTPIIDNDTTGAGGFSGSLIVADFDSLTDAQQWAQADPYLDAGVYRKVSVKPFKMVFPQ